MFKIRVVALIIAFFLLCFFVGLLKGAFASTWEDSPCKFILVEYVGNSYTSRYSNREIITYHSNSGALTLTLDGQLGADGYYDLYEFRTYYWYEPFNMWQSQSSRIIWIVNDIAEHYVGEPYLTTKPSTCDEISRNANLGSPDQCQ